MVKEKVLDTIEKYNLIETHQHIILGLSGGPDSVCLFFVLMDLASKMDLTIHPVHVNHKFRPGAAEEDQQFVEKMCKDNGLECQTFVVDCNQIAMSQKITSEEAGRLVRYQSFAKVAEKLMDQGIGQKDIKIAVAQNADDQAETILFRILRGVGTDGLAGIQYKRQSKQGIEIVRPLLDVTKNQVVEFCKEKKYLYRIDKTNLQPIYTRNKIRLELIPYLEREYNSNIKETLRRLQAIADQDKKFLRKIALEELNKALLQQSKDELLLSGDKLRSMEGAIRQRVISLALEKVGLIEDVTFGHIEQCQNIIFNPKPSARLDLPKNFYITKVYGDVRIGRVHAEEQKSYKVRISIMDIKDFLGKQLEKGSFGAFDYDLLQSAFGTEPEKSLVVRKRMESDYLSIANGKRKKLQDYFVDAKVPKDLRDKVDLFAVGKEILWILPVYNKGRFTEKYKLVKETKKVILVEFIC